MVYPTAVSGVQNSARQNIANVANVHAFSPYDM